MIRGIVLRSRYLLCCLRRVILDCTKPLTDGVVAGLLMDVAGTCPTPQ